MYCKSCGKQIDDSGNYCDSCGQSLKLAMEKITKKPIPDNLRKLYETTGTWSMILAVVGFIFAMAIGFKPEHIVTDTIVALAFAFPRFFFGLRLKNEGIKDLKYARNISLGMTIYSTIVALVNLLSFSGWLYWILIYLYFKSYKETKAQLHTVSGIYQETI